MKAKQSWQAAALRWTALLLTAALMTAFAACGKKDEGDMPPTTGALVTGDLSTAADPAATASDIPTWSIEVRGVPTVNRFTSVDAQFLPKVEVKMTNQNQYGVSVTNTYGGVTLRSILNQFYVPDVVSVVVTSMSGSTATYPRELAMHQDTVLAWEIDGTPIDTQYPVRMCPGAGGGTDLFVESVAAIVVSPLDPSQTTTVPFTTYPLGLDNSGNPPSSYVMPTNYNPPPVYTTVQPTDANGNPITTAAPTTARTTRVFTTRAPYVYVGPPTAAVTQATTTVTATQTNGPTTSTSYNVFGPGGYNPPPTTIAPTTTTAPTTAPTSDTPT